MIPTAAANNKWPRDERFDRSVLVVTRPHNYIRYIYIYTSSVYIFFSRFNRDAMLANTFDKRSGPDPPFLERTTTDDDLICYGGADRYGWHGWNGGETREGDNRCTDRFLDFTTFSIVRNKFECFFENVATRDREDFDGWLNGAGLRKVYCLGGNLWVPRKIV